MFDFFLEFSSRSKDLFGALQTELSLFTIAASCQDVFFSRGGRGTAEAGAGRFLPTLCLWRLASKKICMGIWVVPDLSSFSPLFSGSVFNFLRLIAGVFFNHTGVFVKRKMHGASRWNMPGCMR